MLRIHEGANGVKRVENHRANSIVSYTHGIGVSLTLERLVGVGVGCLSPAGFSFSFHWGDSDIWLLLPLPPPPPPPLLLLLPWLLLVLLLLLLRGGSRLLFIMASRRSRRSWMDFSWNGCSDWKDTSNGYLMLSGWVTGWLVWGGLMYQIW